jgi:S-formylglutathione hydrolase
MNMAIYLVLALVVALPQTAPEKKGTVEHIKVHGKALEGNLEGDSPDRDVFVYLPPSYAANRNQRYPVVYLLHGYGLTAERWITFASLAENADKDIGAGTMKEMILVNPDAFTKYNGSMYSASATIGDWETFIAEDLVSYIDSHSRRRNYL